MKGKSDILKIIAIISMLIDHLAIAFFDNNEVMRSIGRLAYPIFAYQIAIGFQYTRNIKKYIIRIFVFALISIIPFGLFFGFHTLNVLFTLGLALVILYLVEVKKQLWMFGLSLLPVVISMDYGVYGVWMVLVFYYFRNKKITAFCLLGIMTVFFSIIKGAPIQVYAVLSFFLVLIDWKVLIRIPVHKYVFYWFYPIHLLLLYLLMK